MDITASLLTFTMLWKLSWSLHCYTCDAAEQEPRACAQFDYSDKFLVQCQHSTMCYKRVTTLEFGDGLTTQSIQRGCAPQTTNGEQKKINRKWYAVQIIHEVYNETCLEDFANAERATKTLYCYCRGDKCNNAHKTSTSSLVLSIISAVLYVLS